MGSSSPERKRPDKFEHFLNRAKVAAEMSTCLRRRIGAIVVKDGVEVSSGYVGSPEARSIALTREAVLEKSWVYPRGEV